MKIACLQLRPVIGEVEHNQNRASSLLQKYGPEDVDLLILPEMAFSGYVFRDKIHIMPFLEDAEDGPTVRWAKSQAIRLKAFVMVGYPQIMKGNPDKYFNSICFVDPSGDLISTYQKSFLFETDVRWAEEGPGFKSIHVDGLGKVGFGICMDINPYRFMSPFTAFEFANFHKKQKTEIILCSMAWLDSDGGSDEEIEGEDQYNYLTINYWFQRLLPIYCNYSGNPKSEDLRNVVFVVCNRTGTENGITFCGSSGVFLLKPDNPKIMGCLKKKEERVLVVDVPQASLRNK
ncbi:hypothetical protein G9A89_020480 [Geosiphon pyriformis]|nr:hypothetical protein G9A89_020480 [Geosiphon pyriformis]